MRRITKLSAVALSLLLTVPAFAVFDLFGGAEATASAPELFNLPKDDTVRFVQFADAPTATPVIAYVTSDGQGEDELTVQLRNKTGPVLYQRTFDASTPLRNVSALDLSRDGGHLVLGFTSGHILYVSTSTASDPFGVERTFRTRSPVTDAALDASGFWFGAVTYHGDTFLFERTRFLEAGLPYFHHNPIFLFEHFAPDEDENLLRDNLVGDGDYPTTLDIIERAFAALGQENPTSEELVLPLTVRPYTHVEISGRAVGTSGAGLAVIAGDAFGGVHTFNAVDHEGLLGTVVQEPVSRTLVKRPCEEVFIGSDSRRIPCTADALADLVNEVNTLTGGAGRTLLAEVSQRIRTLAVIDMLTGEITGDMEPPIRNVAATEGLGISNLHIWTVHVEDEANLAATHRVHGFRGQFTPGATSSELVRDLWVLKGIGHISDIDLSNAHTTDATTKRATLAVSTFHGDVYTYRVAGTGLAPDLHYETLDASGSKVGARHVAVTTGSETGDRAGLYVATVTDDGQIHLFETTRRIEAESGPDEPYLHYRGPTSLSGTFTDLDLTDTGGALTGHEDAQAGLEVFASLITVRIDPPTASLDKFQTWTGTAIETSPDSTVEYFNWTIEKQQDPLFTPVILQGETISYTFTERGIYNITVVVEDEFKLTATATATAEIEIKPPIIEMQLPDTAVKNTIVNATFVGTHDQDPDPTADYEGIVNLTVQRSDSSQPLYGDLTTPGGSMDDVIVSLVFTTPGVYTVTATVRDVDGATDSTSDQIVIENCPVTAEPCDDGDDGGDGGGDGGDGGGDGGDGGSGGGNNSTVGPVATLAFDQVDMAWDTGHILFFGSGDPQYSGLYDLRAPDLSRIHLSNTTDDPVLGTSIESAKLLPDGDGFVAGLADGRAMFVQKDDPANRTLFRQLGEDAIGFSDVAIDSGRAVFASTTGDVWVTTPDLTQVIGEHRTNYTLVAAFADRSIDRVVTVASNGVVRLYDGDNVSKGPIHSITMGASSVTAADMPENTVESGDTFVFLGRADGRVSTFRIIQDRIFSAGTQDIAVGTGPNGANEPILSLKTSAIMHLTHYKYVVTTKNHIYMVDSRVVDSNEVPDVSKSAALEHPDPNTLVITDDARRTIVGFSGLDSVHVYDRLWHRDPIDTFDELDRPDVQGLDVPLDSAIDGSGSSTTILANGNFLWTFAPPRAETRVGTHNATGVPQFGKAVHVLLNTTFDSTLSTPGDGLAVGYSWKLGDGTESNDANPVHQYQSIDDCKWHNSDNSLECRMSFTYITEVTTPIHTILQDRDEKVFRLYNPPPTAILTASPFNSTSQQVEVLSGQTVRLDGRQSHDNPDNGQNLWRYQFMFGDGGVHAVSNGYVDHAYDNPGVYQAQLKVYDLDKFHDLSDKITIVVKNRAPTATWQYVQPDRNETNGWVTAGVPVQFDASLSTDPDGSVVAYNWTFIDGNSTTSSTAQRPTFTFTQLGLATVQLMVQDDSGAWSGIASGQIPVDDGIRLRQLHMDPDKKYTNPAQKVYVDGHVHDYVGWPGLGTNVPNATVYGKVYYDGPYDTAKAEDPYATASGTTTASGTVRWWIPQNDAGAAYLPGRYRVEMVAELAGSLDPTTGAYTDTEYTQVLETVFFVEGTV